MKTEIELNFQYYLKKLYLDYLKKFKKNSNNSQTD